MFKQKYIELVKQLLESIRIKNAEQRLESAKRLFEEIFDKHFTKEIDKRVYYKYPTKLNPGTWKILTESVFLSSISNPYGFYILSLYNPLSHFVYLLVLCHVYG